VTAQQGFLEIARICGVEEDLKTVKQWLSNCQDHWLLIINNANDPSIHISEFFPTGNNGSILVTTQNPDCNIHATVGSCELGEMNLDKAATLFLKATRVEDAANKVARKIAAPVVKMLGYLALALVQAGAYIRQGLCSINKYCNIYSRHRGKLLKHLPMQAQWDYKYSIYTTWDVSIEALKRMPGKTPNNAIELLRIFCFLHYEGLSEDIFRQAWENSREGPFFQNMEDLFYMCPLQEMGKWDPMVIREAAVLLASFSLIRIEETGYRISMHPLVHVWARDCLSEAL
jgi:hypothetical protein